MHCFSTAMLTPHRRNASAEAVGASLLLVLLPCTGSHVRGARMGTGAKNLPTTRTHSTTVMVGIGFTLRPTGPHSAGSTPCLLAGACSCMLAGKRMRWCPWARNRLCIGMSRHLRVQYGQLRTVMLHAQAAQRSTATGGRNAHH